MFRDRSRCALCTVGFVLALSLPSTVMAEPVLFSGSGTNHYDSQNHSLSATAEFDTFTDSTGTYLKVTLTNTYATRYDAGTSKIVPSDVLTALFFDVFGNPQLTLVSALVVDPNRILNPDTGPGDAEAPPTGDITGGWQYKYSASGSLDPDLTQRQGLGTAGFNVFKGKEVGDVNFGIVNPGYVNGDGNMPIYTNRMIRNAVVFTLTGISSLFNPKTNISNVRFQYGTGLDEPSFAGEQHPTSGTPEPSTFVLSSLALIGLVVWRRRIRNPDPSL